MSFLWPMMLLSLVLTPLAVLLYLRLQRRRQRALERFGSLGLFQSTSQQRGVRRHIPSALFLLGLTILLAALARPQAAISLPRIEGTVILAFDISGSMAAEDIAPTRMEAAKATARAFVQRQPSTVQIGVVAFSDSGFAVQAPSNDQHAILAAIDRLSPQRGTSLGQGMFTSLNVLEADKRPGPSLYSTRDTAPTPAPVPPGSARSTAIVLLTDGENNANPNPLEAAQAAADRGVRIYTVGLGSPAGIDLHANGFTVHTQLDEALLQEIATITAGTYYNAQSQEDLQTVYKDIDLQLVIKPETIEVTALFAAAGSVFLLIGALCSMLWFGRVP
ncbi:MAG: VWA domain-containing protein [Kouleothrix sp.]